MCWTFFFVQCVKEGRKINTKRFFLLILLFWWCFYEIVLDSYFLFSGILSNCFLRNCGSVVVVEKPNDDCKFDYKHTKCYTFILYAMCSPTNRYKNDKHIRSISCIHSHFLRFDVLCNFLKQFPCYFCNGELNRCPQHTARSL